MARSSLLNLPSTTMIVMSAMLVLRLVFLLESIMDVAMLVMVTGPLMEVGFETRFFFACSCLGMLIYLATGRFDRLALVWSLAWVPPLMAPAAWIGGHLLMGLSPSPWAPSTCLFGLTLAQPGLAFDNLSLGKGKGLGVTQGMEVLAAASEKYSSPLSINDSLPLTISKSTDAISET